MNAPSRLPKKLVISAIVLAMLAVFFEVMFFVGGRTLQSKWAAWRVPVFPDTVELNYADYLERRDPVLGWPSARQFGAELDDNGAQRNPSFPDGGKINQPCISLYGDSFTQGGDTSDISLNWGNQLSAALNCYVANYGMGGYGTDQAFIRFSKNEDDTAPLTIFGYHPADTLRNLTRIRDLEIYEMWFALKPRFILDDATGELTLIPIPELTEDEYQRAIGAKRPLLRLEHENLQPGGPAGVVKMNAPYTVSFIRNLLSFYGLHSRIAGEPQWMQFLEPGHPLQGLEITLAITRDFVGLARERGKDALVIILPHTEDIDYYLQHGRWSYEHVASGYEEAGIPFVDFGPHLIETARLADRSVMSYFGATQHYNDDGNAVLAEFVEAVLSDQELYVAKR